MNETFNDKLSINISNNLDGQLKFIEHLENDYIKFVKRWDYENSQYEEIFLSDQNIKKNISNIEISYTPEKIGTKSPFTILNGEWGIGKTHFINEFLSSIKKGVIKPKIIKQFIYIDSWRYLSSNNLINDFIVEFAEKITNNKRNKWKGFKKIIKLISNYIVIPNINKRFGLALPNLNTKENLIKKINKKIKKVTLIFIDNIERLGNNSWEIIRVIQKLSISKRFIFLLSTNLKKLDNFLDSNVIDSELNIDKYINISYYNLMTYGYKDILISYNIPEEYLDNINEMLLIKNENGNCLTKRELEKLIIKFDLTKNIKINSKSKYWYLSLFSKIWSPNREEGVFFDSFFNKKIKEIIKKDLYKFTNDYISKVQIINNKYLKYLDKDKYITFYPYSQIANAPEYRYISEKMINYFEKLILDLEILKRKNKNLQLDINKDILEIKKIIVDVKNDINLQKINKTINEIYIHYIKSNKVMSYDINEYNKEYEKSIFYRLENDFDLDKT